MKQLHRIIAVLALAAPSAAYAANDCRVLAPELVPHPVTAQYDPFDVALQDRNFLVNMRSEDCPPSRNLFLEITANDAGTSDGRIINAAGPGGQIIKATISDRAGAGGGRDMTFNVKAGMTTLYLLIDRGQVVPPGQYRASLLAKARLNNGADGKEEVFPFELIINVSAAVGLAPAVGREIDLGELTANGTAANPVSFDAYANVDYELELISDHGFKLKRGAQPGQDGIAYVPVLDARNLSTTDARGDFARPIGTDSRRRHTLNARVPSIQGQPAGEYEDVLTVQISAKVGG